MKKAPRNKTITLTQTEINSLCKKTMKLKDKTQISDIINQVIKQDCIKAINYIPDNSVDLIIVDPPYNLTKSFSKTKFKETNLDEYKEWLDSWISKLPRILKDDASIYLCSDWKTSPAIYDIANKYFFLQNRITWEREKGRGSKNNWKNCIEDIWFYSKSEEYKFNIDAVKVKRKVLAPYKDENGKAKDWQGEGQEKHRFTHPSNIWTDISIPFWSMPENTPHPTQKPEKLIAKLILANSNENDVIFDPFLGSGTTAVVAKKLNRQFIGIEREKEYCALSLKRLELASDDASIQGYEEGIFKQRNER